MLEGIGLSKYITILAEHPHLHIQNSCQKSGCFHLSREYFKFNETFNGNSFGHSWSLKIIRKWSHDMVAIFDYFLKIPFLATLKGCDHLEQLKHVPKLVASKPGCFWEK